MELKKQIMSDMKEAMKEGNSLKKTTLRMLLSEFQYAQTSHSKDYVLSEDEAFKVVKAYHKKLDKSLKDYPDGDQKKKIAQELAVVSSYLPKAPSEKEVRETVDAVLSSLEKPNFGAVMRESLEKLGSFADAKLISQIIKEKLK